MVASRYALIIGAWALASLVAIVLVSNWPSETDVALAGPCDHAPELFNVDDPPPGGSPLVEINLFVESDERFKKTFRVATYPDPLPADKVATVEVVDVAGDPGIVFLVDPASSSASFDVELDIDIDDDVPASIYPYRLDIECHGDKTEVFVSVWVDLCPDSPSAGRLSAGDPTATPKPIPDECQQGTPTPGPSDDLIWGDTNCDGELTADDGTSLLRWSGNLPVEAGDCPEPDDEIDPEADPPLIFGDWDCSGSTEPFDVILILKGLIDAPPPIDLPPDCPAIGEPK